ncbi:unnamed protein product [Urochloa humidicola]
MASMDNSAAAKLLQRPPPQAAERPAPGRVLGKLSGKQLRALVAFLLVLNYFQQVILKSLEQTFHEPGAPLPWRRAAGVALAYAAAAALLCLLRRLERRRQRRRQQLPDDRDARWEKGLKIGAYILLYPIFFVLGFYSGGGGMTPLALYIFVWVGSRDHVYLGIEHY